MAYPLVAVAVVILIVGLTRLGGSWQRHTTPWPSLLVWAILFVGSLALWLNAGHGH
jgi:hypothetical protein